MWVAGFDCLLYKVEKSKLNRLKLKKLASSHYLIVMISPIWFRKISTNHFGNQDIRIYDIGRSFQTWRISLPPI